MNYRWGDFSGSAAGCRSPPFSIGGRVLTKSMFYSSLPLIFYMYSPSQTFPDVKLSVPLIIFSSRSVFRGGSDYL